MGPAGTGVAFVVHAVMAGALALPVGSTSVLVLVNPAERGIDTLTLPAASSATSRQLILRKMYDERRLMIRVSSGDTIAGTGGAPLTLERRFDQVVLVSDGAAWIVLDAGHVDLR
jgi:hypothetical protein